MPKYVVAKDFTVYDMIVAHTKQYNGVVCTEWKEDLQYVIYQIMRSSISIIIKTSDIERIPATKTQLLNHLLQWGFIKKEEERTYSHADRIYTSNGYYRIVLLGANTFTLISETTFTRLTDPPVKVKEVCKITKDELLEYFKTTKCIYPLW